MNDELLTDEEIQAFKNRLAIPGSQGHYQEWMNSEMQQAINTIEQLQKEKAGMLSLRIEQATALGRKDCQIELLVRAMAFYTFQSQQEMDFPGEWENRMNGIWGTRARDTLFTIPVEALENYRLEQEMKEAVKTWALAYTDSAISDDDKSMANINLFTAFQTLQLHNRRAAQSVDDWVAQKSTIDYPKRNP